MKSSFSGGHGYIYHRTERSEINQGSYVVKRKAIWFVDTINMYLSVNCFVFSMSAWSFIPLVGRNRILNLKGKQQK